MIKCINGVNHEMTAEEEAEFLASLPQPAAPTVADYQSSIQALIDQTAVSKQFNDGVTLASYVNSTIPAWTAQAATFVAWRDLVWTYAYSELAKVQAGQRPQPTVADFLTELPVITWPAAL
ncbi:MULTISPECIES: hypothetical protein [unclassified Rhizobium]|uniref:hypothetical protein n=1 Tax=unclassified Rhizobium TaxID=2613769 RepID=UPI001ADAE750|nr:MULTISPECIES: hypothetical protein [unclassified Rhizobium]MBO9099435.1 hypothetical protein [Rhizobium sp. L58/93]QXZ87079.1 hypothetical protein J5287_21060 [Rhizobium sp. K1/93]QXZ92887.1 hypothetical protein J5280_19835 [Rhizobium sp. K15/93]